MQNVNHGMTIDEKVENKEKEGYDNKAEKRVTRAIRKLKQKEKQKEESLAVAYLKQCLEEKDVYSYGWIEGENIVADVLTKQGSRREILDKIITRSNALNEDSCAKFRNRKIETFQKVKI